MAGAKNLLRRQINVDLLRSANQHYCKRASSATKSCFYARTSKFGKKAKNTAGRKTSFEEKSQLMLELEGYERF